MKLPRIEYYGYLTAASGLGVSARGYLKALELTDYQISCHDLTPMVDRHIKITYAKINKTININENVIRILHVNAEELPRILRIIPSECPKVIYQIGIWAWETEEFPDKWRDRFNLIDELWTGSSFMANSFSNKTIIPVYVIPHVIDIPDIINLNPKAENKKFTFFFSFDYKSVAERKNPIAIINAFREAFKGNNNLQLIIKTSHQDINPTYKKRLQEAVGDAQVQIIDGIITTRDNWLLIQQCDAYVSLHRAEGFGLGMAESMALGKPVLATAYGGNCDYMDENNSVLIKYKLQESDQEFAPYPRGTKWADPDHQYIVKKMQKVYEHPSWSEKIGFNAQQYMQIHHSADKISTIINERLADLQKINFSRRTRQRSGTMFRLKSIYWKSLRLIWTTFLALSPERYHPYIYKIRNFIIKKGHISGLS